MGLKSLPYNAQKMMAWLCDVIRGDPRDSLNVFYWDEYRTNCPGEVHYDPSIPGSMLWSSLTNGPAAGFEIYVDDVRTAASSEEACILASRRVASLCNYHGVQDAARKRRFPSQSPSVWCGAKALSTAQGVYTATTQEKWDKGKEIISRTQSELDSSEDNMVDRKMLEQGRGFLIHLARTYLGMVPFLKGIHHTLEVWRGGRDEDGWKYGREDWENLLNDFEDEDDWREIQKRQNQDANRSGPPSRVSAVTRLHLDLEQLKLMMEAAKPPRRLIQGKDLKRIMYAFGDASGAGFGSMWGEEDSLAYRVGVWGSESNRSSNFRELKNLLDTLDKMKESNLAGVEVYMFTDNSTSEAAYYKGSSTSKDLHAMVGKLWAIELEEGCKINVVHVAGERMKAQGTDGLSRGNMLEGSMTSRDILAFVPLHLSVLERDGGQKLLSWLHSWVPLLDEKMTVLKPEHWWTIGQDLEGYAKETGKLT